MKGEKEEPEHMGSRVLSVILFSLGVACIPLLLLDSDSRFLIGMIAFVLAYVAGMYHIQRYYEKNARITLGEVSSFVRKNGFEKTEYQGVRTWRHPSWIGWRGFSAGAYSGMSGGRRFILSVYTVPRSGRYNFHPYLNFETHMVCVDMPLGEDETPVGLDPSYEHDKIAKRISGSIYGTMTTREKIEAMMEHMAGALARKPGKEKPTK